MPRLVVFIGGTSGLGLATLQHLLASPNQTYRIILGSRSPITPALHQRILSQSSSPENSVQIYPLDLNSQASIRTFASNILDANGLLDSIILCAGQITHGGRRTTSIDKPGSGSEQVEETLQVNVLSQALLLHLLLPRLRRASGSRVVFVASALHRKAAQDGLSPSTLNASLNPGAWDSMKAYRISKLVQMHLFYITTDYINAWPETNKEGTPIVIAVSPGFVPNTGLVREHPWYARLAMRYLISWAPFATSIEQATNTIVKAITDTTLTTGTYMSKAGQENPAEQYLDAHFRTQWETWLVEMGVWGLDAGR